MKKYIILIGIFLFRESLSDASSAYKGLFDYDLYSPGELSPANIDFI